MVLTKELVGTITLKEAMSVLEGQRQEEVPSQVVVHAGNHIAVHQQRVRGETDDRWFAIGEVVDAKPQVQMRRGSKATLEIEVVICADMRIHGKHVRWIGQVYVTAGG